MTLTKTHIKDLDNSNLSQLILSHIELEYTPREISSEPFPHTSKQWYKDVIDSIYLVDYQDITSSEHEDIVIRKVPNPDFKSSSRNHDYYLYTISSNFFKLAFQTTDDTAAAAICNFFMSREHW